MRILKLTLTGVILSFFTSFQSLAQRLETVAGIPPWGLTADKADLKLGRFVVDANQDVFFTSAYMYIGKIDHLTKIVTPLIGTGISTNNVIPGPGNETSIGIPSCLALLPDGDILFAVWSKIWRWDKSTGSVSHFAGAGFGFSGDGGPAISADFSSFSDIATNSLGDVFVSDGVNRIRKIDHSTFIVTTVAGNGTYESSNNGGLAINAAIQPQRLLLANNGDIYFSETLNHVVRKIDASTGIVNVVAGNYASGSSGDGGQATSASLNRPFELELDGDNLYIADVENNKIRKLTLSTGIISTHLGTGVRSYSPDGALASVASIHSSSSVRMISGELWFSEIGRLRKITNSALQTIAGNGGFAGDGGPAQNASLWAPKGVVLNHAGDLIFSDASNNRIRKIDGITGLISTIAGTGDDGFAGDNGPASSAKLSFPGRLAIDANDNIFYL